MLNNQQFMSEKWRQIPGPHASRGTRAAAWLAGFNGLMVVPGSWESCGQSGSSVRMELRSCVLCSRTYRSGRQQP
jgi:hypothetical protein